MSLHPLTQVKKCLEVTKRLGGANFVMWGGRDGYQCLLNTDYKVNIYVCIGIYIYATATSVCSTRTTRYARTHSLIDVCVCACIHAPTRTHT